MKTINYRLNAPQRIPHADTGIQSSTRNNGAVKKNKRNLFSSVLLSLILLLAFLPHSSRAGDVNPGNVFGSVTNVNVKYETG